MKIKLPILFLAALLAVNCSEKIPLTKLQGYSLTQPDGHYVLPPTLHEISGITEIDSVTFGCIQDENGILFIYDTEKQKITAQHQFGGDGDYEAVTRVGKTIYVLRSDGMIYELKDLKAQPLQVKDYFTGIPVSNNEGLCYDADNKRLLIGCKSKTGKGPDLKDQRVIYGFNLKTKQASNAPVLNFSVEKIIAFASQNNVELPLKAKGKTVQPVLKFGTSEIAIHPFTRELYVLSAVDHLLMVFDLNGEVKHLEKLDPHNFNKAEGITFCSNGDLVITNEGEDTQPTLLRFKYQGKTAIKTE